MSRSPKYWVVKREHANHYFRVETGTFVPTREEATHFAGECPANDVRDMLRAQVNHYKIATVRVYGPRVKTADEGYQDGWDDALVRVLAAVDESEKFCKSDDEKVGNSRAYNAIAKLKYEAADETHRYSAAQRTGKAGGGA